MDPGRIEQSELNSYEGDEPAILTRLVVLNKQRLFRDLPGDSIRPADSIDNNRIRPGFRRLPIGRNPDRITSKKDPIGFHRKRSPDHTTTGWILYSRKIRSHRIPASIWLDLIGN
jgi:hypothetical protein